MIQLWFFDEWVLTHFAASCIPLDANPNFRFWKNWIGIWKNQVLTIWHLFGCRLHSTLVNFVCSSGVIYRVTFFCSKIKFFDFKISRLAEYIYTCMVRSVLEFMISFLFPSRKSFWNLFCEIRIPWGRKLFKKIVS